MIEAALRDAVEFQSGCPNHLAEAIRYAVLAPGKRLRPRLALLAAEACSGDASDALGVAVAVEMIHAYSLVHDDLPAMDNDDLRRGRPTCHKQFDEATAILVGDALQARAFEILATNVKPAERALRCVARLSAAAGAESLVGGQSDDLAAEFRNIGLARLESIHRRKTGALFKAALEMGGISVGGAEEQIRQLSDFGESLGHAFQIVDDLLDVGGEESRMGKRIGKDRGRGKVTYPALLGIDESRRRVAELVSKACAAIEPFGVAGAGLRELAEFVGQRTQ
jgi:geranylgeranyl diphosphate synthase type II